MGDRLAARRPADRSTPTRVALLATTVLALLVLLAPRPALAHTALVEVLPPAGSTVSSLDVVEVRFTEPVAMVGDGIRLLDGDGEPVAAGPARVQGASVVLDVEDLPEGDYLIAWRVVPSDGHPITGTSSFELRTGAPTEVGVSPATTASAPIASAAAIASSPAAGSAPAETGSRPSGRAPALAVSRQLAVAAEVLAALVLVGAWAGRRVLLRRDEDRLLAATIATGAARAALAATAVLLPLRIVELAGTSGTGWLSPAPVAAFLNSATGRATVLRLAALGIFLLAPRLARRAGGRWLRPLAAAAALGSFAVDGHSRAVDDALLGTGADVLHLLAGAAWLGGLAVVVGVLRNRADGDLAAVEDAEVVARFSRWAVAAVALVSVTGAVLADAILPDGAVVGASAWGMALVVKTVLVAVVVGFGAWNHVALVDAVRGAARPPIAGGSADVLPVPVALPRRVSARGPRATLRRTVRVEVALLSLVLVVTGGLVDLSPPAPAPAGAAIAAELDLGGGVSARLAGTVDAGAADRLTVELIGPLGRPPAVDAVRLDVGSTDLALPPQGWAMAEVAPGTWQVDADLFSLAGDWELDVVVRTSRFTQASRVVLVEVPAS